MPRRYLFTPDAVESTSSGVLIPRRRIWTRQPVGQVSLDRPMSLVYLPSNPGREIVSNKAVTYSNALVLGNGPEFYAAFSSATGYVELPDVLATSGPLSIVVRFKATAGGSVVQSVFSRFYEPAPYPQNWKFTLNTAGTEAAWGSDADSYADTVSATGLTPGRWYTAVGVYTPGRMRKLFIDGRLVASRQGSGAPTTTSDQRTRLGAVNNALIYYSVTPVALAAGVRDGFSDAEAIRYSNNPWGLFAYREPIFYSLPSAGGSTTTVTVDQGSLTLTGQSITGSVASPVTQGSTSLTGQSVAGVVSVPVSEASVSLTGQAVTGSITVPVTAGTLSLTGSDITIQATGSVDITVDAGSLTLTGQSVTGTVTEPVTSSSTSLTGQVVTGTITVPVLPGTLSFAGSDITVNATGPQTVTVEVGSLTLTGQDVGVSYTGGTRGGAATDQKKRKKRRIAKNAPDEALERLVKELKGEDTTEAPKTPQKPVKAVLEPIPYLEELKKQLKDLLEDTVKETVDIEAIQPVVEKQQKVAEKQQDSIDKLVSKVEQVVTVLDTLSNSLEKLNKKINNLEDLLIVLNNS